MEDRPRHELEDEPGIFVLERPDDINSMTKDEVDEYKADLVDALNTVLRDFQSIGVHPSQLTSFDPFTVEAQKNSLSLLLVHKGIITQEEHDVFYFELMLKIAQMMRRDQLPDIRRQMLQAGMNGGSVLGPDGMPIDLKRGPQQQ